MTTPLLKPDLPLRLLSSLLGLLLRSPLGAWILKLGQRYATTQTKDWVEVTHLDLTLPRLRPEFSGLRLVQISDFHIGTWLDRQKLDEVVALVNQQEPDLVAITGDFVTSHPERHAKDMIDSLKKLSPRLATLAVLGNHDHWSDPVVVRQVLKESGIIDLSNAVLTFRRGQAAVHFAGIDDYYDGKDRLDLVLDQLPDREAAILLAHEPDFAKIAAGTGLFDLQISGHSHGGQIRIPWIGPPFLPRHARKYPSGYYQVKGMILYTNRGLGTAEFQLRINCRPEITVFSLHAPQSVRMAGP